MWLGAESHHQHTLVVEGKGREGKGREEMVGGYETLF